MADTSTIEWTDSTFNSWIGCTKVGPGCDHCYAEELARRYGWADWGSGKPRHRTAPSTWAKPLAWNREPFYECRACGARGVASFMIGEHNNCCPARQVVPARRRVFCASLADVFDNEVDPAWRVDLLDLIRRCGNLDFLLLTKRIGNVVPMLREAAAYIGHLPRGELEALLAWVEAWLAGSPPHNVWLGATVVNQEEADRDIPKLLQVPARVRFLSCEPLLGPLNISEALQGFPVQDQFDGWIQTAPPLNWVIAGGESGPAARPMHPEWVKSLRDQCAAAGAPFLFKQWGEWAPRDVALKHFGPGYDPAGEVGYAKLGKKAAGRELDGREWSEFPRSHP